MTITMAPRSHTPRRRAEGATEAAAARAWLGGEAVRAIILIVMILIVRDTN